MSLGPIPLARRRGMRRARVVVLAGVTLLCSPVCGRVSGQEQAAAQPAAGQAAVVQAGCTLRIHVDGFRNTRGNLGTVVFKSADGWPEDLAKSFRHGPAPIDAQTRTATAEWPGLAPGDYAVAAIHDENSNHKLDRNLIGIPKEGFGFANNPHVGLTAPGFKEALVHVACPVTEITIHLQFK